MRKFAIAAAVTAALGVAGVIGWQANAAVPAGSIPRAGPYTPIQHVGCRGGTGSHGCGAGYYWRNGPGAGPATAAENPPKLASAAYPAERFAVVGRRIDEQSSEASPKTDEACRGARKI